MRRNLRANLDRLAGRQGASDFSKQEFRKRLERLREIEQRSAAGAYSRIPREHPAGGSSRGSPEPAAPVHYGRMVSRRAVPHGRSRSAGAVPVSLGDELPCSEIAIDPFGRLLQIEEAVAGLDGGHALNGVFAGQFKAPASPVRTQILPLLEKGQALPGLEQLVFMDVESTGLGSNPLFLIGVMLWEAGGFVVRQYFARSYAEERAVVAMFLSLMQRCRLLVTFNGKSFDWPYIKARAAATGVAMQVSDPLHLDLLHAGRRAWKHELPNCKLQTLERFICGRTRSGDIPSAEIPEAYHAFVRTGDAFEMVPALEHNKLDLVTLADLMTRFPVA